MAISLNYIMAREKMVMSTRRHTFTHIIIIDMGNSASAIVIRGGIGDMFEGTMKPKEQAFVKEWIIRYKSKLNRRWRSQNFTRVDSSPASEIKNAQRLIDAIEDIESRLKKLRTKLLLRKMELYASEASSSLTF